MDAERLCLDGNALAGLLYEAFGHEMTTTVRACPSCGENWVIGAHRAYWGAGLVLRCPGCDDVALVVVVGADQAVSVPSDVTRRM